MLQPGQPTNLSWSDLHTRTASTIQSNWRCYEAIIGAITMKLQQASGIKSVKAVDESISDLRSSVAASFRAMKILAATVLLLVACHGAHGSRGVLREPLTGVHRVLQQAAGNDAAQHSTDNVVAGKQAYLPAPGITQCYTISDRVTKPGKLCVSQLVKRNVTKIVCNEFKPECVQTIEESHMLVPGGTATSNPDEFNMSSDAACKILGYRTFAGGSVHMTGGSPAAKDTCWNGQSWISDNWWVQLTCCN